MNNVGILGGGFGLYGYLPALGQIDRVRVILPQIYKETVLKRPELRSVYEIIDWVDSYEAVLNLSSSIIICKRPIDQSNLIEKISAMEGLRSILLEKPIAPNPEQALKDLNLLQLSNAKIYSGFVFRFLPWYATIYENIDLENQTIDINWTFMAHHYRYGIDSWKRHVSSGGGAIRFFGIHLIAMLANMGETSVESSLIASSDNDEAQSWKCCLLVAKTRINIFLDTRSKVETFGVRIHGNENLFLDIGPFGRAPFKKIHDPRVEFLQKICTHLVANSCHDDLDYCLIASRLWKEIELNTIVLQS